MNAILRQGLEFPVDIRGTLLVYDSSNLINAIECANRLRQQGIPVCTIAYNVQKKESQYVEYASNSQLDKVVFMMDAGLKDTVTVIKTKTNKKEQATLEDLLV